jgi:hypothetical protein
MGRYEDRQALLVELDTELGLLEQAVKNLRATLRGGGGASGPLQPVDLTLQDLDLPLEIGDFGEQD